MSPIVFTAVNRKPDSEIMHYYRDQDLLLDLLITTSAPSAGSDSISAPEHTETGSTKPEVVIPSSAFIKPVVLSEHGTSTPASTCGFMSVYAASTSSTRSLNKRDTDAMTGMIGDPSKSVEFSGSSSAASFMRQINAAIDARLGSSGSNHSSTYPSRTTSSPTDSKVFIDPLAYTLPQRSFADSLVQDYYDLVWVILPVHDWTIFRKAYQSIWLSSSSTIPEHILYCMVNLTFALGSQFSQAVPPSDRREMGQTFWKRAHMLFDPRSNEEACLEGVQCFVLSMTFGRPSMIADWLSKAVPLPSMIDDDFLDTQIKPSAVRPDGRTTEVAFFIKSLELYSIVNDALRRLYMGPMETSGKSDETLTSVLQLDSRLTKWARSIPEQLSCTFKPDDEDFIFQRQRIVLRAR
ncbi:hypothetical protein FOWG_15871 [Fusarium oxysporum f. sp. lycopersici MN25]|nr:hypothetical protein FOWG_15871 [Fusarium oxysporum f. sp. lycopersici MN25]